jgi:hypothetical protein
MGIRLSPIMALAIAACAPEPQAQEAKMTEEPPSAKQVVGNAGDRVRVAMAGSELEIGESGRHCVARLGEQSVALQLPPPCRLLARGNSAAAAVHEYDGLTITLVAGPLAPTEAYEKSDDRQVSDRCSHMAQPVIFRDGKLSAGRLQVSNLGFCAAAAPDEKLYYGLAHPVE